MENQHRKIKGYRELSQAEIDLMNTIKSLGQQCESVISELNNTGSPSPDSRWIAIGETHLQQGIMALVRSVAKPESF